MDNRSKARRFLVYRAWKAADDPLVSPTDIARVTGLPYSTVIWGLRIMGLSHGSRGWKSERIERAPVDTFMASRGFDKRETRFAYFGD